MALSADSLGYGGRGMTIMRSPPCWFIWGAWRARSTDLQAEGWQFEHNQARSLHNPLGDVEIALREPRSGMCGLAYARQEDLIEAVRIEDGRRFSTRARDWEPEFRVRSMRLGDQMYLERSVERFKFASISMEPEIAQVQRFRLEDIFTRRQLPKEEIIVEPKKVADLLEEIRKLQEPELAAIRQKNRLRDATRHLEEQPMPRMPEWQEEVSASIITLRKAA